ncbi:N,N-dimethylformamidase beta subunit family domain-containing protein [Nonomuraea sp. NPDC050663]|uniref:N,N-dimethylformamidase beta subunit family domain-containing protein n=1 Tax=Nonomuraea sp. NPDC050663 TaxID=3364370 RepID=UPI00378B2B31
MRILFIIAALLLPSACFAVPEAEPPRRAVQGEAVQGEAALDAAAGGSSVATRQAAGTPVDWRIERPRGVEGFADRVSVLPGESFRLYVSTRAPRFVARAMRVGSPTTQVWVSKPVEAAAQPAARLTGGMVSAAHWKPSLTVETTGWPEGAYLIRLETSRGHRYVPITVRSASTAGKVVILNAVTTWQAYNRWGGRSLYSGPGGFSGRSPRVSFDRPYDRSGARLFLDFERDAIELAERSGAPLAYLTDLDLKPGALDGATALFSLGHDEYWSPTMRSVVTRARDRGTNLAFLGANAVYWRIAVKGRVVECDKAVRCRLWRSVKPESELIGQQYDCFPAEAAYVVTRADHWIFEGTEGRRFPGLAGVETDKVSPGSPANVRILAESPVDCGGRRTVAHSTYYVADSGAGVFASGTMRWICGMRGSACGHGVTDAAAPFTRRATMNLLRRFSAGPAESVR